MTTEVDIAWAAGLFEGEGCVAITKSNPLMLNLSLTDLDVLQKFHSVVVVGQITGPTLRGNCKPIWKWACTKNADTKELMAKFYPYLGNRRRKRIDEALANHQQIKDSERARRSISAQKKLSPELVSIIRREHAAGGISQTELAGKYSVCQPTVNRVINRRTWQDVR